MLSRLFLNLLQVGAGTSGFKGKRTAAPWNFYADCKQNEEIEKEDFSPGLGSQPCWIRASPPVYRFSTQVLIVCQRTIRWSCLQNYGLSLFSEISERVQVISEGIPGSFSSISVVWWPEHRLPEWDCPLPSGCLPASWPTSACPENNWNLQDMLITLLHRAHKCILWAEYSRICSKMGCI